MLPRGTGQDFGRTHGIPTGFDDAVRVALDGRARGIDLGRAELRADATRPRALLRERRLGRDERRRRRARERDDEAFGGRATFFYALAREFVAWQNTRGHGRRSTTPSARGPMHDVILANGRWHGGGMKLAPDARPDDGLFDVVADRRRDQARPPRDGAEALQRPPRRHPKVELLAGLASRSSADRTAAARARRRAVGRRPPASRSSHRRCAARPGCVASRQRPPRPSARWPASSPGRVTSLTWAAEHAMPLAGRPSAPPTSLESIVPLLHAPFHPVGVAIAEIVTLPGRSSSRSCSSSPPPGASGRGGGSRRRCRTRRGSSPSRWSSCSGTRSRGSRSTGTARTSWDSTRPGRAVTLLRLRARRGAHSPAAWPRLRVPLAIWLLAVVALLELAGFHTPTDVVGGLLLATGAWPAAAPAVGEVRLSSAAGHSSAGPRRHLTPAPCERASASLSASSASPPASRASSAASRAPRSRACPPLELVDPSPSPLSAWRARSAPGASESRWMAPSLRSASRAPDPCSHQPSLLLGRSIRPYRARPPDRAKSRPRRRRARAPASLESHGVPPRLTIARAPPPAERRTRQRGNRMHLERRADDEEQRRLRRERLRPLDRLRRQQLAEHHDARLQDLPAFGARRER